MSTMTKNLSGLAGGLAVTGLLLSFLLAGAAGTTVPARSGLHGAIRLSTFEAPPEETQETYATADTPVVQPMERTTPAADLSMAQPSMEMDMPAMDMPPEAVGTMPVAGLGDLARPSAPSASGGGALALGEVDEKPRPLYAPPPLYPTDAKAKGDECAVTVRIILDKDGTVVRATPVGQTPASEPFHAAAVEAVRQWRFIPCKKDGRAVRCMADQPFTFNLAQ